MHRDSRAALDRALDSINHNSGEAAETLSELLKSTSDSVKLRAATVILQFALQSRELTELEDRLSRLEQAEQSRVV